MNRSRIPALLAAAIPLICVSQAAGQQACRPTLAFAEVQFSEMQPSTLERKWTAVVSVDASRCAANATATRKIALSQVSSPRVAVGGSTAGSAV